MPQPDVRRCPAGNRTPSNHIADHDTPTVRVVPSLEDVANAEKEMRSKALEIGHLADQAARTGSARDVMLVIGRAVVDCPAAINEFRQAIHELTSTAIAVDDQHIEDLAAAYLRRLGYGLGEES